MSDQASPERPARPRWAVVLSLFRVEPLEQLPPEPRPGHRTPWLRLLFAPEELPQDAVEPGPVRKSWLRVLLAPERLE